MCEQSIVIPCTHEFSVFMLLLFPPRKRLKTHNRVNYYSLLNVSWAKKSNRLKNRKLMCARYRFETACLFFRMAVFIFFLTATGTGLIAYDDSAFCWFLNPADIKPSSLITKKFTCLMNRF